MAAPDCLIPKEVQDVFRTTTVLFITMLALLTGGVAAHQHPSQRAPDQDLRPAPEAQQEVTWPIPEPGWQPLSQGVAATDRALRMGPPIGPYIEPAPNFPTDPSAATTPTSAVACLWRNPMREVLDRLRWTWRHGKTTARHSGGFATRMKPPTPHGRSMSWNGRTRRQTSSVDTWNAPRSKSRIRCRL